MSTLTGQLRLTNNEVQKIVTKAVSKRLGLKIEASQVRIEQYQITVDFQPMSPVTVDNVSF